MERSRKSLVLFLLAVFGLILTPWAKEYWQEKPYNRWNEQEAMAMLTHSPWSQSSTIPENYAGSSPPGSLHLEEGAPTSAPDARQMGSAPTSSDLGMSRGIGGGNSIPVHIRWCSSQRVRQAMFRLKQLHGNLTEAQGIPQARHAGLRHLYQLPDNSTLQYRHLRHNQAQDFPALQKGQKQEDWTQKLQPPQGAAGHPGYLRFSTHPGRQGQY
jgi:hypothetical protein